MKRPWLCRIGWHKHVPSVPDPVHGVQGYWRTECPRCGALWCFSYGPFLVARRWLGTRIARPGEGDHIEPYDDWPMCPECWVRFETTELLAAHYDREPECAAHPEATR